MAPEIRLRETYPHPPPSGRDKATENGWRWTLCVIKSNTWWHLIWISIMEYLHIGSYRYDASKIPFPKIFIQHSHPPRYFSRTGECHAGRTHHSHVARCMLGDAAAAVATERMKEFHKNRFHLPIPPANDTSRRTQWKTGRREAAAVAEQTWWACISGLYSSMYDPQQQEQRNTLRWIPS